MADAFKLLERPEHSWCSCVQCAEHVAGALYLAGYAVELALKVYVMEHHQFGYWEEARVALKSRGISVGNGHDLSKLVTAADLDMGTDPQIDAAFRDLNRHWSTDLRYSASPRSRHRVRQLVGLAGDIHDWVERQTR